MSTVKTITSNDLFVRIATGDGDRINVGLSIYKDGLYALPTLAYLRDVMLPAWMDHLDRIGKRKWTIKHDCNRFHNRFCVFANDCFDNTTDDPDGKIDGFAVYRIFYKMDSGGGHAISAAWTDEGCSYIEPQTGEIVTDKLSEKEKASIYHAY